MWQPSLYRQAMQQCNSTSTAVKSSSMSNYTLQQMMPCSRPCCCCQGWWLRMPPCNCTAASLLTMPTRVNHLGLCRPCLLPSSHTSCLFPNRYARQAPALSDYQVHKPPHKRLTWPIMLPTVPLSAISLFKPFSNSVGKLSRRSVCPVGAVSNTITL